MLLSGTILQLIVVIAAIFVYPIVYFRKRLNVYRHTSLVGYLSYRCAKCRLRSACGKICNREIVSLLILVILVEQNDKNMNE